MKKKREREKGGEQTDRQKGTKYAAARITSLVKNPLIFSNGVYIDA